jgi:glycosyltransferase involved in cell wall biosynthesis
VFAFGDLANRHDDLCLVIAGHDGPARPAVDAAIDRLPERARSRVVLAGGVDDPTRRALLERAAVLAYPSIYEGFGFPVLEAMTVGVPVVAARAGSIPEVAGDAALLVEPTNEAGLARELDRVISDDRVRDELIARGHTRVRDFRWDDTARALVACYQSLAGN